MLLSFTAIGSTTQFREFCCQITTLEMALDILTKITAKGDTILKAHLTDGESHTELPTEIVDGLSFSEPLQQLQKQWQTALSGPVVTAKSNHDWLIDITRRRVELYDDRISQFDQQIAYFEEWFQRIEKQADPDSRHWDRLLDRFTRNINLYRRFMQQTEADRELVLKKLSQLELLTQ